MLGYALKKLMYNLSLCLAAYMLIFFFSRYQRVYAGWFAGAAGRMGKSRALAWAGIMSLLVNES